MNTILLTMLFTTMTNQYNLPKGLLSALCFVESSHKITAIHYDDGQDNSIGVCQVQPKTARFLKFKGTTKDLFLPNQNVKYAAAYLRYQLNRYNNDVYKAVAAYNAGSFISKDKKTAVNKQYVKKVFKAWSEQR